MCDSIKQWMDVFTFIPNLHNLRVWHKISAPWKKDRVSNVFHFMVKVKNLVWICPTNCLLKYVELGHEIRSHWSWCSRFTLFPLSPCTLITQCCHAQQVKLALKHPTCVEKDLTQILAGALTLVTSTANICMNKMQMGTGVWYLQLFRNFTLFQQLVWPKQKQYCCQIPCNISS